jgi:hypothetical protein
MRKALRTIVIIFCSSVFLAAAAEKARQIT